ncbi:MAG TPA: aspartyl protease family protein, partial [Polyangiaceae bacterium]
MTRIKLANVVDQGKFREGLIPAAQVRQIELDALVDTGATLLALPEEAVSALGLEQMDSRSVQLADGSVRELPLV